jgi:O-antigen ligase
VALVDGVRWLRAYGLTFHPNVLGGFLVVALLLTTPWLKRLQMIGLWWLLWLGLALTLSRAAWLAAVLTAPLALLAVFLKQREARAGLALAVAGVVAIGALFFSYANAQFLSRIGPLINYVYGPDEPFPTSPLEERSLSERAELSELAWEIIAERPLQGVGAGNFALAVPRLRPLMISQSVHNVPLLLAAEVGLLGSALWLLAGITVAVRLITNWSRASAWLVCACIAWLALLVVSSFDSYPWALNSGLLLTVMSLGVASRSVRDSI